MVLISRLLYNTQTKNTMVNASSKGDKAEVRCEKKGGRN